MASDTGPRPCPPQTRGDPTGRLLTKSPGGPLVFKGALSEPGRVTVNGQTANVDAANQSVPVTAGTTSVTINAVDASGNATEAVYEVDQAGTGKTFTYDANGNMTSDGTRTFEWDARNELVAVNVGTHRSEFAYDGLQRRVSEIERENGAVESDMHVLWCETSICEERAADGIMISRRLLELGDQTSGDLHYFVTDHLGSVRKVTDGSGAVEASYDFDPSGRRIPTSGDVASPMGFTGHRMHTASGLLLSQFRGLDPDLNRWISPDPIGFLDGANHYRYVGNEPVSHIDRSGLACQEIFRLYLGTGLRVSIAPEGPPELLDVSVVVGGNGAPLFRPPTYLVTCLWAQRVTKTRVWSRRYCGIFECTYSCGKKGLETSYYEEKSVTTETYVERWGDQFDVRLTVPLVMASVKCRERTMSR